MRSDGQKKRSRATFAEHLLPSTLFSLPPPIEAYLPVFRPRPLQAAALLPPLSSPLSLPVHQRKMEGGGGQDIVDRWRQRRLARRDDRRGRSLAEENDDNYRHRMDDPPDYVVAAWTRLDKSREKTAELSALYEDDHTQHTNTMRP